MSNFFYSSANCSASLSLCKKNAQSLLDISDCGHVKLMFKTAGSDGFSSEELKDNLKQTEIKRNI